MKRYLMGISIVSLLGLTVACKPQPAPPTERPSQTSQERQYVEHVIKYSGETLADIAAWYTGRSINWTILRDANPTLRPSRLRIGQMVLIPKELVVNEQPMPKTYLSRGGRSESKPTPSAEQTPSAESTPEPTPEATPEAVPTEEPVPTPEPVVSPVPTEAPTPEPASTVAEVPPVSTATPSAASPEDAEREKLLDEMLK